MHIFSYRVGKSNLATTGKVEGRVYHIDQKNGERVGLGMVASVRNTTRDLSQAQSLLSIVAQVLRDGATISKQAERLISGLKRS